MRINGEPLAFLRKSHNLTIEQLSARSGVSKRTIETIESGKGNSNFETLCMLSDALGAPIDILCGKNLDMYHVKEDNGEFQIVYYDKNNKANYSRVISYLQLHQP